MNGTSASVTLTDDILGQESSSVSDFAANYWGSATQLPTMTASYDLITNNSPDTTYGYPFSSGLMGTHLIDTSHPDPQLGTLGSNGGPTETMAISSNSPAYNFGTLQEYPGTSNLITTDQRGDSRADVQDIGSLGIRASGDRYQYGQSLLSDVRTARRRDRGDHHGGGLHGGDGRRFWISGGGELHGCQFHDDHGGHTERQRRRGARDRDQWVATSTTSSSDEFTYAAPPDSYIVNDDTDEGSTIPGTLGYEIDEAIYWHDPHAVITFDLANDATMSIDPSHASSDNSYGLTAFVINGGAAGVGITLDGPGTGLSINASYNMRVFAVTSTSSLTLENLTVRGALLGADLVGARAVAVAAVVELDLAALSDNDDGTFMAAGCDASRMTFSSGRNAEMALRSRARRYHGRRRRWVCDRNER